MIPPLVSIILPTYNVADYLEECLVSITNQTYKNIEIIVVIDGATDGSLELAQEYGKKDARVTVIYQDNAGSGPARNNGIDHASGEFIAFIDPDDWVKPDYIETLVSAQQRQNADLVLSGFETHFFIHGVGNLTGTTRFPKEQFYSTQTETRNHYVDLRCKLRLLNAPWAKLFKVSVLKENKVRFPDLRRSQDIYFNSAFYNHIETLAETTYAGYCYRVLQGERIKKIRSDYYKTSEILYNQMIGILEGWGIQYNKTMVKNLFYLNILQCFESQLLFDIVPTEMRDYAYVNHILHEARPSNVYHKIMRILLINNCWFLAKRLSAFKKKVK